MKTFRSIMYAATCGALIMFTACGSGDGDKSEKESKLKPKEILVEKEKLDITVLATGNTMMEMAYSPGEIKIRPNSTITIHLVNQSTDAAMIHNFVLIQFGKAKEVATDGMTFKDNSYVKPDDANVIAYSKTANPGETVTVTFEAPPAGTYQYICTYPGHWMQMQGKLIVE